MSRSLRQCTVPRVPIPVAIDRSLHLLDVENLLGGRRTNTTVAQLWQGYLASGLLRDGDLVIAALGAGSAQKLAFELPRPVRLVLGGHGPDAADHALLEAVDVTWVAQRFSRVVIGSGDGIFTGLAECLHHAGLDVHVAVSHLSHLSGALRRCAGTVCSIVLPPPVADAA
jgi:hypothetical protein